MKRLLIITALLFAISTVDAVPFKLKNNRLFSIYLEIPGVMNPNLSPMSVSGVDLAVGQKIYYYEKGKRIELLTVDESLRDAKIDVGKLIKKRRLSR